MQFNNFFSSLFIFVTILTFLNLFPNLLKKTINLSIIIIINIIIRKVLLSFWHLMDLIITTIAQDSIAIIKKILNKL